MKQFFFFASIICASLLFSTCGRKTKISGMVLTSRANPVSGARLTMPYSEGGKSQTAGSYDFTTDAQGKFSFNERIPKKRSIISIIVTSDSGRAEVPGFQAAEGMEISVK